MDVMDTMREFIEENFMVSGESIEGGHSASFLESGVVDSTGILEIVEFIEERFEITVEDEELVPENLDSIQNLTNFVRIKLRAGEKEKCVV